MKAVVISFVLGIVADRTLVPYLVNKIKEKYVNVTAKKASSTDTTNESKPDQKVK